MDVVHVDPQHSHHSARVLLDFPAHQQLRLASLPSRLDCHYCATTTTTTAQTLTFPSHCCSDFSCRGSKPERVTVPVSCKNLLSTGLADCSTEMATQCLECATCLDVWVGDEKLLEGFKSDLVKLNLDFLPGGEDQAGLGRAGKPFLRHLIGDLKKVPFYILKRGHLEVCIGSAHLLDNQSEKVCPSSLYVNWPLALSHHHRPEHQVLVSEFFRVGLTHRIAWQKVGPIRSRNFALIFFFTWRLPRM